MNSAHRFFVGGTKLPAGSSGDYFQLLEIVFIKCVQTISVVGDDTQQSVSLIQC